MSNSTASNEDVTVPASVRSWAPARTLFWVLALSAIVLGGCAVHSEETVRPVTKSATKPVKKPANPKAKTVPRMANPLADRALLQRQPAPNCTFRGPVSNPITAEEARQKLDYEQQCYRQAESIARERLHQLQDAIDKTPKVVRRQ